MPEPLTSLEAALGAVAPGAPAAATERFLARARDDGLVDVAYASIDSPVGELLLAATPRGLVRVAYEDGAREMILAQLADWVSPRVLEDASRLDSARRQLDEFFAGRRRKFELPLDWSLVHGFRRGVLRTTAAIPYGEVATYGEVAARTGRPRAARAAGTALALNPLPIVVPCHRVVRAGGAIGEYGGGPARKQRLLALEGAL